MTDLTPQERAALMRHLLAGRDFFAGRQPRLAEWFSDRLVELDDDRREAERFTEFARGLMLPNRPGVAEIIPDDDGDVVQ